MFTGSCSLKQAYFCCTALISTWIIFFCGFPARCANALGQSFPNSRKGTALAVSKKVLIGSGGHDPGLSPNGAYAVAAYDLEAELFMRGLTLAVGMSAPTWAAIVYAVLR